MQETLSEGYILSALFAAVVGTALTRFLPFFALRNRAEIPLLQYLQTTMPLLIMTLLVFFTLKDVEWSVDYGIYEIVGIASIVLCFLWSKNTMLSMALGIVVYMVATHYF